MRSSNTYEPDPDRTQPDAVTMWLIANLPPDARCFDDPNFDGEVHDAMTELAIFFDKNFAEAVRLLLQRFHPTRRFLVVEKTACQCCVRRAMGMGNATAPRHLHRGGFRLKPGTGGNGNRTRL